MLLLTLNLSDKILENDKAEEFDLTKKVDETVDVEDIVDNLHGQELLNGSS